MIKTDNDSLLMIEPKEDKSESKLDYITELAEWVWNKCKKSDYSWKGFHKCICGEMSDNRDWFTPKGRLTNSLMLHYIREHRQEVPQEEIYKLFDENEGE